MHIDLRGEYRVWTNTEAVDLESVRKNGNLRETIGTVKRRNLTVKQAADSGGAYQSGDVVFSIPVELTVNTPKPADRIHDAAGNAFTVLEAAGNKRDSFGPTTWRCVTRNLAIHYQLDDTITIEESYLGISPFGVESHSWQPVYTGVRAKVYRSADTPEEARGMKGFKGGFQIYIERPLAITDKHRIVWPGSLSGYLDIVGYHDADRIDSLPIIDAEERL